MWYIYKHIIDFAHMHTFEFLHSHILRMSHGPCGLSFTPQKRGWLRRLKAENSNRASDFTDETGKYFYSTHCYFVLLFYVLVAYLFCDWKFVFLNPLRLFHPIPSDIQFFFSVSMSLVLFCLICFLFRFHIQVRAFSICLSLSDLFHLISYPLDPSSLL